MLCRFTDVNAPVGREKVVLQKTRVKRLRVPGGPAPELLSGELGLW